MDVSPSPIDLTTLASAKSWVGVTGSGDDANIQLCITAASREWLRLTGRGPANWQNTNQSPFNQPCTFTETYDGNGNSRKFLRNSPIISVQSLQINGDSIAASPSPGSPGYVIDSSGKSISLYSAASSRWIGGFRFGSGAIGGYGVTPVFLRGIQNVQVSYTAGYDTVTVTGELQAIPASPGPYVLVTTSVWLSDSGVSYFSNGQPLTPVQTAPAQGQYYVQAPGQYLFNAADAGQQVLLSYVATGTPQDIVLAVNQMVALNYKRRQWIGQRSVNVAQVGSVSYTQWAMDPSVTAVLRCYTRTAITT